MRILVVEDEAILREDLAQQLAARGFTVQSAADGEEGLRIGTECDLEVAIIELGRPGIFGLDVIRRLRENGRTFPVIVLAANSRWEDKVDAFAAGADDYVSKPFEFEELFARLKAVMRRAKVLEPGTLTCGPLVLDTLRHRAVVSGRVVNLSVYESRILQHLMLHSGEVVSRQALMSCMYEEELDLRSNTLTVHVTHLRKKIDPEDELHIIEAVRGQGYLFGAPRER
jgi:two-component system, OmpR family, response regulator PhoP